MAITSDAIIDGVNRRISNPITQGLLQNSDVLAFTDSVIQSELIPLIESTNQDFFVQRIEIPLVAGQSAYPVPYRSVGRALREIKIVDTVGGGNFRNIPLVSIEHSDMYFSWNTVVGFHFEGDDIRLVPDVPDSLSSNPPTLVVWYRLPPNKLVPLTSVAPVVSIADNVVTVSSVPTGISAGTRVDFCQAQSGSAIYSYDVEVTATDATTITFASSEDIPSELSAGDYISVAGESYVLNWIPNEAYPLVETLTCRRALQAISDYEGLKILEADAERERTNLKMILEPRINGESTIIVNYWSLARGYKSNQRAWLYGQ